MEVFGMCSAPYGSSNMAAIEAQKQACEKPEQTLARIFREDLGVDINAQALRMFVRHRFDRLSPLAHKIHRGE